MEDNGFKIVRKTELEKWNLKVEDIIIPTRKTEHSAGYDIHLLRTPESIIIPPHKAVLAPTGIKCRMSPMHFLQIVPRSSVGIKKGLMLQNTTGIIDSDYCDNRDNGGHIFLPLYNYTDQVVEIAGGTAVAQGILLMYFKLSPIEVVDGIRVGGIGSTD